MTPDPSFWRLAYELCGLRLLGRTQKQPLGSLPMPLRRAVLEEAVRIAPGIADVRVDEVPLNRGIGRPRRVLKRWGVSSGLMPQYLGLLPDLVAFSFTSPAEYFEAHGLGPSAAPGMPDEHFAERLFVEGAYVDVFGLKGLSYLKPQVRFTDSTGVRRRIDFVLQGARRYAIEIEGRTFHDFKPGTDPEKFADEKARQRELALRDFTYFPIPFSAVKDGTAARVLESLKKADELVSALADQPQEVLAAPRSLRQLLFDLPNRFPLLQSLWLGRIRSAIEASIERIEVREPGDDLPVSALALLDTIAVVEKAASLAGVVVNLPRVTIRLRPEALSALRSFAVVWFHGADLESFDLDSPRLPVLFEPADDLEEAGFADGGTLEVRSGGVAERFGEEELTPEAASLASGLLAHVPARAASESLAGESLDFFARRFFPIAELKQQQIEVLRRSLAGQSTVAILPTGYGKSLIFQLHAVLCARPCIVVTPLVALIRDQVMSLHKLGIQWADSITSADDRAAKDVKLSAFKAGALRLLYVAPERLRIRTFAKELLDAAQALHLGGIVVDEVHCVSEWGHDFRPAYLQIPAFRAAHERASGETIPLLGLTATASDPVRKDICRTLELPEDAVVQLQSSDRPNLSLSVHPVSEKAKAGKTDLVADLVRNQLPKVLGKKSGELLKPDEEGAFSHAGIVFAMYATTLGKGTIPEGVPEIAARLTASLGMPVPSHSGKAPKLCPKCGGHKAVYAKGAKGGPPPPGRFQCLGSGCGAYFDETVEPDGWDERLLENHEAFQANRFPLLVATKGFGMGIDKPNIRYVIHHSFSGGFEGYYQEAGRAGRDNAQAHIALLFKPPAPKCQEKHLIEGGTEPPCISDPEDFKFFKCAFGLNTLCDYGRQAHFIKDSYPGVGDDVRMAMALWRRVTAKAGGTVGPIAVAVPNGDEASREELAAFRLQQLGAISSFVVDYPATGKAWKAAKGKGPPPVLIVTPAEFAPGEIRERLRALLWSALDIHASVVGQVPAGIDAVIQELGPDPSPGEEAVYLERALSALYEQHVYRLAPEMRKRMLRNQLAYASTTKCRRIFLRGVFDRAVVTDDFECGFCDVCVPGLDFKGRKHAEVPLHTAELEQIAEDLDATIRAADVESLLATAKRLKEIGAQEGMLARVAAVLESEALPGAFYLAGALARWSRDRSREALGFLMNGLKEALRRGMGQEELRMFAREAISVDAPRALPLLLEDEVAVERLGGIAWLADEAARSLGLQDRTTAYLEVAVLDSKLHPVVEDATQRARAVLERMAGSLSDLAVEA